MKQVIHKTRARLSQEVDRASQSQEVDRTSQSQEVDRTSQSQVDRTSQSQEVDRMSQGDQLSQGVQHTQRSLRQVFSLTLRGKEYREEIIHKHQKAFCQVYTLEARDKIKQNRTQGLLHK